jgi:hypothetical protein
MDVILGASVDLDPVFHRKRHRSNADARVKKDNVVFELLPGKWNQGKRGLLPGRQIGCTRFERQ